MNLAAGERHETVSLEEIKHTLTKQICHDTDMVAIIETVSQMDTLISVLFVIRGQSGQHSKFDSRCIAVLLDGADNLDCAAGFALLVKRFNHLAKGTLS